MRTTKRIPVPKKKLRGAKSAMKKNLRKTKSAEKKEVPSVESAEKKTLRKTKSAEYKKPFIGAKSAATKESKDAYIKRILEERKKKK